MTTSSDTAPATASSDTSSPSFQESAATVVAQRPELTVGAAFAGGLLVALILKRLAA